MLTENGLELMLANAKSDFQRFTDYLYEQVNGIEKSGYTDSQLVDLIQSREKIIHRLEQCLELFKESEVE